jgi:hypothetical protein
MCHRVHVPLSAADRKDVKALSGVLIPVYATVVLAVIAVVAVNAGMPRGNQVATVSITTAR